MENEIQVMSVAEYKSRWLSGHEHREVLRAEEHGYLLSVEIKKTIFGNFAVDFFACGDKPLTVHQSLAEKHFHRRGK